jgi:hypothetical protein
VQKINLGDLWEGAEVEVTADEIVCFDKPTKNFHRYPVRDIYKVSEEENVVVLTLGADEEAAESGVQVRVGATHKKKPRTKKFKCRHHVVPNRSLRCVKLFS